MIKIKELEAKDVEKDARITKLEADIMGLQTKNEQLVSDDENLIIGQLAYNLEAKLKNKFLKKNTQRVLDALNAIPHGRDPVWDKLKRDYDWDGNDLTKIIRDIKNNRVSFGHPITTPGGDPISEVYLRNLIDWYDDSERDGYIKLLDMYIQEFNPDKNNMLFN